jgi:hypothetical protein
MKYGIVQPMGASDVGLFYNAGANAKNKNFALIYMSTRMPS